MKPPSSQSNRSIQIRGARVNNLKGVDVDVPRGALTVITGLSGSGKSSLAFDTLYAEGQRRFVESLSSFARQFLDRMNKPDVDSISGLPPAVAIEQQGFSKNPRSTVATTTEIYDLLRVLYGRVGVVLDKDTGEIVRKDTPESVLSRLTQLPDSSRLYLLYELPSQHADLPTVREALQARGYSRVVVGEGADLTDIDELTTLPASDVPVYVLVDRVVLKGDDETRTRLTDSLEQAFDAGSGRIVVRDISTQKDYHFSSLFENAETRTLYIEPEPRLFSFNNPFGACPTCQGFGRSVGIDPELVVPDKTLSLRRGALHPFRGETYGLHLKHLIADAAIAGVPVDKPYHTLTQEQIATVWSGFGKYIGVSGFFKMLEEKSYKTHYRVMLSRYRGYTTCSSCGGSRLRTAARQVFVGGRNIPDVVRMTLREACDHFVALSLSAHDEAVVGQIVIEIRRRLQMLCDIGLDYLTLDRLSHSLSGGESQRINLATSLGSALVGTLYVLDEPSIGLHPRDTGRLLDILHRLKGLGNTVVVVEHDLEVIQTADYVLDIGPGAGENGGTLTFSGTVPELRENEASLTGAYLSNRKHVHTKSVGRPGSGHRLVVKSPVHHNLKGDDVQIPLGTLTVITGVSGSGKSSLVHDVLYGGVQRVFGGYSGEVGQCERIEGLEFIGGVQMIDQAPIGRSSRSTPATYTKIFDMIRDAYASTQAAKQLGWKAGHFSFNVSGGRCEVCEGAGTVTIEMQFLPDIELPCEACNGTRYKRDAQNILFNGRSIIDVLGMSVTEAIEHFKDLPRIVQKLSILRDVGLGYIRLGQPSTHLSGGEAQRIKLAANLDTPPGASYLYIFDEPTTGLHVHDVTALLAALERLVDKGHTAVVIEHNVHVMSAADWIIDMGPEGGAAGGHVVCVGTPAEIAAVEHSYTGAALREHLAQTDTPMPAKKKGASRTRS